MTFAIGAKQFAVQKEDLGFADAGNGMVYGGIQSRGTMEFDILGDTFLKGIYAVSLTFCPFIMWDGSSNQRNRFSTKETAGLELSRDLNRIKMYQRPLRDGGMACNEKMT